MRGRGVADVVFVLDSSSSMEPCIEGVKRNISTFLDVFRNDPNHQWDLRLEMLAHADSLQENRAAGIDRDFRDRVVAAGGQYDDVDLRASLIWNNRNDLDLHVIAPSGEEVYFANKVSQCGGVLDVDRNISGETITPVENVRWGKRKAPKGRYRIFVRNFKNHEQASATDFRVEVCYGGQSKIINGRIRDGYEGEDSDHEVLAFDFDPAKPNQSNPSSQSHQQMTGGTGSFRARSIFERDLLKALYGGTSGRFFTNDISAFQAALSEVRTGDNECPYLALDCALDLPWRQVAGCHRVVVLFTDEPVEGGNRQEESIRLRSSLIDKLHKLKVLLYLITPASDGFEVLSAVDKSEWIVVEGGDGLKNVQFGQLLGDIGKSISASQTSGDAPATTRRALFGQDRW